MNFVKQNCKEIDRKELKNPFSESSEGICKSGRMHACNKMDEVGVSHQEEIHSLRTSRLAGQIDPSILPDIHFLPVRGAKRTSWHKSGADSQYWDFFNEIRKCQKTCENNISDSNRQSFLQLTFHEQLAAFGLSQQLTNEQSRVRWQIAIDTLYAIRTSPEHRKCDAFVCGCLFTGVGKHTSTIYISVDIDGDNGQALARKSEEERKNIISDFCRALEVVLTNAQSPHDPARRLFIKVRLLGKNYKFIQLREAKTRIEVHLTIDNQKGIRSIRLLKFYMEFEPSTKQIIIFLKYWSKFHRISKQFHLNHWAWTLLILVFLMEKKLLPSAFLLQAIATFQRSERGEMNNQDTQEPYFCDDPEVISKYFSPAVVSVPTCTPEENTKKFLDLLTDFFKMVETTEFATSLVSPQLGQIVQKEAVAKAFSNFVDALPIEMRNCWNKMIPTYLESMNCFTENEAFFIEALFEPGVNTATMWNQETSDELVTAAKHTLSILSNNPSNFLQLFALPSEIQANEFAAVVQQSDVDRYIQILVEMLSKLESEEERIYRENTANEIRQIFEKLLLIPGDLFRDTESFDAIRLNLSTQFFDKYMVSLYSAGLLGGSNDISNWHLSWQITALWRFFTSKYLKDIFRTGLRLTVEKSPNREVDGPCPLTQADTWTYDDIYTQNMIENLRKAMVNQFFDGKRILEASQKVQMLWIPENAIKYGVFKLKVTYPFWKRKCVIHSMQNCSVHAEAVNSLQSNRNYLDVTLSKAETSAFTPFFIYILYRLDARADEASQVCGKSSIAFLVQEVIEKDVPHEIKEERKLARKCVVDTLDRTFESYQLHQIANWTENGIDILNTHCCSGALMI